MIYLWGCIKMVKNNRPNVINEKIKPFRAYVQKVFPAIYDDSLSYYELLAKIMNHLNEIGKLTNEMVDLWLEINEWVLNDGLADAVSEKLDQYVSDGTLSEIINEDIFNLLNDKIEEVEKDLKVNRGDTYGTFETAAVSSIIGKL